MTEAERAERELAEPTIRQARAADFRLASRIERELAAAYGSLPPPQVSPALARILKTK